MRRYSRSMWKKQARKGNFRVSGGEERRNKNNNNEEPGRRGLT